MKIEIVDRQPARVAYLRYTGPLGAPVTRFWRNTVGPWLADHGLTDCPRYGVTLDDPRTTLPEKIRYDACVELAPGLTLPDAPETIIPGGRYAVTAFKGTDADIGGAWMGMFGELYANPSLYPLDESRAPLEHYPRGAMHDTRTGKFTCELCVPLRASEAGHP